jgi:hypothetical protein
MFLVSRFCLRSIKGLDNQFLSKLHKHVGYLALVVLNLLHDFDVLMLFVSFSVIQKYLFMVM